MFVVCSNIPASSDSMAAGTPMLPSNHQYDPILSGERAAMASLITHEHLKALVREGQVVVGGDPDAVEGIKYDFRLGNRFLKASLERPVDFRELHGVDRAKAKIEPGEVVFVMSEEKLHLPMNMFVVLSHKRKISHDGIAVMGGLCVDPGYDGYLLVGLHNFSSSPFAIEPGRKLIAGLFYRLEETESGAFPAPGSKIADFPEDLVKLIKSYQPMNLTTIAEQMAGMRSELTVLQREISDDKKWRQDFKEDLDGLLAALKDEKENRQQQYRDIETKITGIEKDQIARNSEKSVWDRIKWAVIGSVVTVGVGILIRYGSQIIKFLAAP
jgi:deoxycytidine triphosphate deaminase